MFPAPELGVPDRMIQGRTAGHAVSRGLQTSANTYLFIFQDVDGIRPCRLQGLDAHDHQGQEQGDDPC